MPTLTGGFGPSIRYKNLSVAAYFNFVVGNEIVNLGRMATEDMYYRNNQSTAVLRRWRREGDVTDMPRALYGTGYNSLGSSRYVEKGDYMRLKSLTVSYDFGKLKFVKSAGLQNAKLFVSGYDLLTWTNYKGQEPEVGVGGSWDKLIGADHSRTPRPARFTVGFNVQF
jgi:hypothetical protein